MSKMSDADTKKQNLSYYILCDRYLVSIYKRTGMHHCLFLWILGRHDYKKYKEKWFWFCMWVLFS